MADEYDVLTRDSDGDWCAQEIEAGLYEFPYKSYEIKWEFVTANPPSPWIHGPIGAGTTFQSTAVPHHPGAQAVLSGAPANSGYYWIAANNNLIVQGKERVEFIFKTAPAWGNKPIRLGFQNSITINPPTNGAYLNFTSGRYLNGVTRKAGVQSTTGTGYNTSASTWYRGRMITNPNADNITFFLCDADGEELWTDILDTNIPTAVTGFGALVYYTVADEGTHIITIDLAHLVCARGLIR